MRRHLEKDNVILLAEGSDLNRDMALMVVKNKQCLATNCLSSCVHLKMMDPLKAKLNCSPSI